MLNIIKADLQRIFRGKGVWITLGIFMAYLVLASMQFNAVASRGEVTWGMEALGITQLTGSIIPLVFMFDNLTRLYFMTSLLTIIITSDFTSGSIKNVLSSGVSRMKYLGAKFILVLLFSFVMILLNITIPTVLITFSQGFGRAFDWGYVLEILLPFLLHIFGLISVMSVGICFGFIFKKSSITLGAFLAFVSIPPLLIFFLSFLTGINTDEIARFEIISLLERVPNFVTLSTSDVRQIVLVSSFWLIVSVVGGVLLFKKTEVK